MNKLKATPGKLKALLSLCIFGVLVSIGVNLLVYNAVRNTAVAIGNETAPSIIDASNINALLADAHSNAMNAMVTKERNGGKFWTLYRKDMVELHSRLIDINENIIFGENERNLIQSIMSNTGVYEYTLGGAVSTGAQISVDQFGEANRLMQQKLLPASVALNNLYTSYLNDTYNSYTKNIGMLINLLAVLGCAAVIVLLGIQVYLFRKTHRVVNIGLALATILLAVNIIYTSGAMNSIKSDIYSAKHNAFDSVQVLWSARATAYNANALESLYLLHNGTGIVQTADTINFNLSSSLLCSDTKAASGGEKFDGYLGDELKNTTFDGEDATAKAVISEWVKYVDTDKKIRNLEYDNKHSEAIALCVGDLEGQSNYQFAKFDSQLGNAIDINQKNFDTIIKSVFKILNVFPYISVVFLLLIVASCVLGFRPRLEEYRA